MLEPAVIFTPGEPFDVPLTDEALRSVEAELGRQLPAAYVDLARRHNGGWLAHHVHPAPRRTTWADDHVSVVSLAAIGRGREFSLCGIGVYFGDCPAAGHDMIALDCRSPGEPPVVHVDEEWDYRITVLAPDFETFVRGLTDI